MKKKIPKELMTLVNGLDYLIVELELDAKILTYNQLRMICTYFWDFSIQLYPQVDFVILQKLEGGISPLLLDDELSDPSFWEFYISLDSQHAPLIDVFRVLQKLSQYCAQ